MTSRSDELAEAVEAMLRLWPEDIITGESGDPGPCAIVACRQALHRYRNSAPSDGIPYRIAYWIHDGIPEAVDGYDPKSSAWAECRPPDGWIVAMLPKPAPVPEITAEEVES